MSPEDRVENITPEAYPASAAEDAPPSVQRASLSNEERTWGMLCHLSALLASFLGGLSFLGPLICWLVKKDTSKFVDDQGREALNFQLNMLIYVFIAFAITLVTCGIGLILFIPVSLYSLIMPIIAGIKANSGERFRYPLTIRIL